jgi:hypothetical protein
MPLQLDAGLLHYFHQHFHAVGLSSPPYLNHIISGKSTTYDDQSGKRWEKAGRTGKRRQEPVPEVGKGGLLAASINPLGFGPPFLISQILGFIIIKEHHTSHFWKALQSQRLATSYATTLAQLRRAASRLTEKRPI